MPKVTDKQFQMEKFLINKLELIKKRVTERKLDAVMMVDGDEGFGKTGISILCAYYLSHITKRKFNLDHIFFDPKEFIKFINTTKNQIIIWDEAALGGLASSWQNKVQQMLIQTLMTCRFRKHIIFFNCPKFYRLNAYFVMERATGLIHVYSHDKINAGRFIYYKKELLEKMVGMWGKKKTKPYKIFYDRRLRGHFVDAFKLDIIDEDKYDNKKEHYTEKLLAQYGDSRYNDKLLKFQHRVATNPNLSGKEKAELAGVSPQTIVEWKKIPYKYPEIFKEVT